MTPSSITDYLPDNIALASNNTPTTRGDSDLGQEDFLELMITQLQNQDPTNPADSAQFLSQIAEFSVVEGIAEINESFDTFANSFSGSQTIDAINLVGRTVVTDTNRGYLDPETGLQGTIDLPRSSSGVTAYIQDESGALVGQIELGPTDSGQQTFSWDGLDADGVALEPGIYRVSAEAFIDGQIQAVSAYAHNRVDSVVLGDNGNSYQLSLEDGSTADLSDVRGVFQ